MDVPIGESAPPLHHFLMFGRLLPLKHATTQTGSFGRGKALITSPLPPFAPLLLFVRKMEQGIRSPSSLTFITDCIR